MTIKIIDTVALLANNTAMGRPGRVEGTRELIVPDTPFLVPYRAKEGRIEILRVLHHSQRWPLKL